MYNLYIFILQICDILIEKDMIRRHFWDHIKKQVTTAQLKAK